MDEQTRLLVALARQIAEGDGDAELRAMAEHALTSAREGAFGHAAQRATGGLPDDTGAANLEYFVVRVVQALDDFLRAEARRRVA